MSLFDISLARETAGEATGAASRTVDRVTGRVVGRVTVPATARPTYREIIETLEELPIYGRPRRARAVDRRH